MRRRHSGWLLICLILFSLVPEYELRRGGGGIGGARSGGGGRSSGGFGSRGSSGARTSGGLFGGSRGSSGSSAGASRPQPRPNNGGGYGSGGGGWNQGGSSGGYRGNNMNTGSGGSKGGLLGGLFGRKNNNHHYNSGGYGNNNRGGMFGGRSSSWSNSGIGSRSRGSTFKNMIVGAAAGYLTYQAGKAIIRAAAGPMMWNNRPYYWGMNHYRASPGHSNVCRMPIDSSDPQFGNVYFQDQTRPREITWGCGYYEYCCGYECCRGGGAPSDRIGGRGSSIGYALVIAFLARRLMI